MELLLNDLSIHEQFHDAARFREAVSRIASMRNIAHRFGRELHCHRNIINRQVNPSTSVFEALQRFTRDERRSLLTWLTQQGPFWEDVPAHGPHHWLEVGDEIVTDTAIGEAAYCSTVGIDRRLVSLTPSSWERTPISVKMLADAPTVIKVDNYWAAPELEAALMNAEPPITSWNQLESVSVSRYQRLRFSSDSFRPLDGQPFVHGVAYRIISLLNTLDRLMGCVDESGLRTPAGNRILQDHFTGGNAWFTDSSDTEKRSFRNELTFPHPDIPGHRLFCTWHGKVRTKAMRIHFSWPVAAAQALYVVYVGPKITKT